ncbi:MAG: hypothetical protein H6918_05535 [Sphingomonadaceae bacterium]|nr:hypothetical protein [Sphingomonadaceae bacterium]
MLLEAIAAAMPQYPIDAAFEAGMPSDLAPLFDDWRSGMSWRTSALN